MNVAYKKDFCDNHYDPRTGRFISEDPIIFNKAVFNSYQYARNNPMTLKDPTGEGPVLGFLCGGGSFAMTVFADRDSEEKLSEVNGYFDSLISSIENEIVQINNSATAPSHLQCPDPKVKESELNKRRKLILKLKNLRTQAISDINKIRNNMFDNAITAASACLLIPGIL